MQLDPSCLPHYWFLDFGDRWYGTCVRCLTSWEGPRGVHVDSPPPLGCRSATIPEHADLLRIRNENRVRAKLSTDSLERHPLRADQGDFMGRILCGAEIDEDSYERHIESVLTGMCQGGVVL